MAGLKDGLSEDGGVKSRDPGKSTTVCVSSEQWAVDNSGQWAVSQRHGDRGKPRRRGTIINSKWAFPPDSFALCRRRLIICTRVPTSIQLLRCLDINR